MTLDDLKGKTLVAIFPTDENSEAYKKYGERLKGKIYKILCDREEGKEWKSQRNAFLILLYGTTAGLSIDVMEVAGKIGALDILDDAHFKKTIFESMNLLDRIFNIKR